ncbi:fimbria/pilus outer membrane usher protein [Citrobacter koseri]|uniref:fimbria/pilus outer membrane usher protein n=1 Tax=Citrobacter koseri TaxID=545 RepID=UPI001F2AF2F9|nr:fimbria/pilus outer membrane usher protein [Citrobacter koseri]
MLYAQPVSPSPCTTCIPVSQRTTTLYAELWVNTVTTGDIVPVYEKNGLLYLQGRTLYAAGLSVPDTDDLTAPSDIPGVTVNLDMSHLRLFLMAPTGQLRTHTLDTQQNGVSAETAPPLTGLILNYSTYLTRASTDLSASTWSEVRTTGLWNTTFSTSQQTSIDAQGEHTLRLDTTWQHDFPDRAFTFSAGDITTSAPEWGRSVRAGGVRLSRNFALTPYQGTAPPAAFAGDAVLPSTVDIYINGIRQSSQKVPPGPFTIQTPPLLSGAGKASMTATDITGQTRTWTFDIYGTSKLLQAGMLDASVESGLVRHARGVKSSDYDSHPLLSGTLRYGLTNTLTPQFHAELTRSLQLSGAGADWLLPVIPGVFSTAVLMSNEEAHETGHAWFTGYRLTWSPLTLGAELRTNQASFKDAASASGSTLPASTASLFLGVSTAAGGLSTGYVRQKDNHGNTAHYQSLGWSVQTVFGGNLNLSYSRQISRDSHDNVIGLNWSVPAGERLTTTVSSSLRKDDSQLVTGMTYAPEKYGSPGLRLIRSNNESRHASYQADVTTLTHYGDFAGGFYRTGESSSETTSWASANGSMLFLPQGIFPATTTDSAFALVSTRPAASVPVSLENRPMGKTDRDGLLLVGGLNAFQRNLISVDPSDLPAHFIMHKTREETVPQRNAGVAVTFAVQTDEWIQLTVRDEKGQDIPQGAGVRLVSPVPGDAVESTQSGYGGRVYLPAPAPGSTLFVATTSISCNVKLTAMIISEGKTGPFIVTCKRNNTQ